MEEVMTRLGRGGRLVIPARFRKALGLRPGELVIVALEDGEITVTTPKRAVQRAQAMVRRYVPAGRRLSEELVRERREEVARG